jgi:hypothetical protein
MILDLETGLYVLFIHFTINSRNLKLFSCTPKEIRLKLT